MKRSNKNLLTLAYNINLKLSKIKTVKGTRDILDEEFYFFDEILKVFEGHCSNLNYRKISTPILEFSDLFSRTLGEISDIVSKEMFSFIDQSDEDLTLRPEGTAPLARALLSNSMYEDQNQKFFYSGPMFRREKPQAGRLRQFNQVGVEYFNQRSNFCDLEVIILANLIIKSLDIDEQVDLHINTIGNWESRKRYTESLKDYLTKYEKELSDESRVRLYKNPLRILDSKSSNDKKILVDSPVLIDFLDLDSRTFYEDLKEKMEKLNIQFTENRQLVRGLDYYNHSVFEFITKDKKSQNTILAGGRYDDLVRLIGGKQVCGVGWAAGVERIINLIKDKPTMNSKIIICLFSISSELDIQMFKLINVLSDIKTISIHVLYEGNFKKKLNRSNKLNASASIILGEDEFKKNKIIFKDLITGKQVLVELENLKIFLEERFK